jgi:hypothetical protein
MNILDSGRSVDARVLRFEDTWRITLSGDRHYRRFAASFPKRGVREDRDDLIM